jgi:ornithine lipid ester-linked acyl 2-hydroxylase
MFVDPISFPFVARLQSSFGEIRSEYDSLSSDQLVAWPESDLYDFGWRAFGLMALGRSLPENCSRCPRTAQAIAQIGGIVSAGFSLLAAGARIRPHKGYTNSVLRFHLGIKIPSDCGLEVGSEVKTWAEGKVLAFDDTTEHSAWNDSSTDRAILLLDVLRPGANLEVTPAAVQALEGYLRGQQRQDVVDRHGAS